MSEKVGVGVGVIIKRGDEILVGRRIGGHAQGWSVPGGGLKPGETIEQAAVREIAEETKMRIGQITVIGFTNNLGAYESDGVHNLSAVVIAEECEGEPELLEPTKCAEWRWCRPDEIPEPQTDSQRTTMELFFGDESQFSEGVYRTQ
jgi:8-oxo-dGTP diphosphatase